MSGGSFDEPLDDAIFDVDAVEAGRWDYHIVNGA
jgi:hypothetical protein